MRSFLALWLCLMVGCGAREPSNVNVTVPVSSTLGASAGDDSTEREKKEQAERDVLAKFPDYASVPLEKKEPAPDDGVLFSPRRAAQAALDQAASEKLGTENKVLVKIRQTEIDLYEKRIKELQLDLKNALQKSFWDEHKAAITGVIGALLGAGFSLGIFKAANHISEN